MTDKKVWFITGAGRGLGADIARAALAGGHAVVATGRDTDRVARAVGDADDLLVTRLDITSADEARAAVRAAVDRFGRIDVLVNNAAAAQLGFFEETSPELFERHLATNLLGPMTVTRALLPVLRAQRSGLVLTISSTAGLQGLEFVSAYAAAKFGLEGWMESLAPEIAPYGIGATLVEPGAFRTELLSEESSTYGDQPVDDYADRTADAVARWRSFHGAQDGDPAKLAAALVTLAALEKPPLRFIAGTDAVAVAERKAADLRAQVDAFRDLSLSLDHPRK